MAERIRMKQTVKRLKNSYFIREIEYFPSHLQLIYLPHPERRTAILKIFVTRLSLSPKRLEVQ